ncbi:hypothetical protein WJX73_006790 [Symbiochloris irregularis]|uniref:Uncharacterized protein n=1 Tax=Symbiochloris irregularis TaxID=706552 RepID=A0AAW1P0K8_9CHLO
MAANGTMGQMRWDGGASSMAASQGFPLAAPPSLPHASLPETSTDPPSTSAAADSSGAPSDPTGSTAAPSGEASAAAPADAANGIARWACFAAGRSTS